MALTGEVYSNKEIWAAVAPETTVGTYAITTVQLIDIVDVPVIKTNMTDIKDVKFGDYRVTKSDNVFRSQYGTIKEITFTCRYDATIGQIIIENLVGVAVGSAPDSIDIAYNYSGGAETYYGATGSGNLNSLAFVLHSPRADNNCVVPGCMVKSVKIYGDSRTDGGILYMDVVMQSSCVIPANKADSEITTKTAFSNSPRTIWDLCGTLQTHTVNANIVGFNKIEINVDNNLKFFGINDDGARQAMVRGIDNIAASIMLGVKNDESTVGYPNAFRSESEYAIAIYDTDDFATSTFGVAAPYTKIDDDPSLVSVEEAAFIDVLFKCYTGASGNLIQIIP